MCPMRCLLTLALLSVGAGPVAAQEKEAEKLFRSMEKKVHAAKTLRLRYDATITDSDGKKWTVKGTLILGEGDKFRVEIEGKLFGEAVKGTQVSDGTDMSSTGANDSKMDKKEKAPKDIG